MFNNWNVDDDGDGDVWVNVNGNSQNKVSFSLRSGYEPLQKMALSEFDF